MSATPLTLTPMSDYNPLDLKGQEQQSKDDAQRVKTAEMLEADDLKWLMSSKRGRRICRRALERAGVYRLSFNTNSMTMAFNEGMRNEGLRLLDAITKHCPELYAQLLKEANE